MPSFDFQYGGGNSYHFQRIFILEIGLIGLAAYYSWVTYRFHREMGVIAAIAFVLYAGAMFTGFHDVVILFMGHGSEIAVGSCLLARVIFDAVPRRPAELEVHGLAGWSLIFHPVQVSWGLIHDPDARDAYWAQKGSEGLGDFSRIADYFGSANETPVAWFCIGIAVLGVITPFAIKWGMTHLSS